MSNKTNKYIQAQVSGYTEKTCWSMLWQRKTLTIGECLRKQLKENTSRIAFAKFVKEGWAIKPKGTKNLIEIADEVTK